MAPSESPASSSPSASAASASNTGAANSSNVLYKSRASVLRIEPLRSEDMINMPELLLQSTLSQQGDSGGHDAAAVAHHYSSPVRLSLRDGASDCNSVVVKSLRVSNNSSGVARMGNEYHILTAIQEKRKRQQRQNRRVSELGAEESISPNKKDDYRTTPELGGSSIRAALGKVTDGGPVLSTRLEYIEGISLKEWIHANNNMQESKTQTAETKRLLMLERIHIAHGICAALAEVHDCGVVHHDVSTRSFIVQNSTIEGFNTCKQDTGTRVKIISFGDAAFDDTLEADDTGERVNDDIPALGRVLRSLFSIAKPVSDRAQIEGADNDTSYTDDSDSDDEYNDAGFSLLGLLGPSQNLRELLPDLPRSVQMLLRNLHDAHNVTTSDRVPDPYYTARDVERDISQMADDPDRFLFDDADRSVLQLQVRKSLYGRERQSAALRDVCDRFLDRCREVQQAGDERHSVAEFSIGSHSTNRSGSTTGNAEVVLVSGQAGAGKADMVRNVVTSWLDDVTRDHYEVDVKSTDMGGVDIDYAGRGYLIEGQYDELQSGRPYSAIADAIAQLSNQILQRGHRAKEEMASTVQDEVGSLGGVLVDCFPALEDVIGAQDSLPPGVTGTEAKNRFRYIVRKFFRAVSTLEHPVVLFLQDLQWADAESLWLLEGIVTATDTLVIGSYRNMEVENSPNHPLSVLLAEVGRRDAPITKIHVGDMDADAVSRLISDATGTFQRLTLALGELVTLKTSGNAFAVSQTIRMLADEGALYYDDEAYRWKWDEETVRQHNISDDVVGLFTTKLQSLPPVAQETMKVASGFGMSFNREALQIVVNIFKTDTSVEANSQKVRQTRQLLSNIDLSGTLEKLTTEGMIIHTGSSVYKFVHNRIQQAAYLLAKPEDTGFLHLQIGNVLFKLADKEDHVERDVFLICDQLNRGCADIKSKEDQVRLATLNLQAGEKAMKSSAFAVAPVYLRHGLDILSTNDLLFSSGLYDVSLRLNTALGAAQLVNGNFDDVKISVDRVLDRSTSLLDKFPAYMSLVKSLVAQGCISEAITTGFGVLAELGEPMPKSAGMLTIMHELIKTKLKLRGMKDSTICSLPPMEEPAKLAAMQMLALMVSLCYVVMPEMIGPVTFRMIRLTLRYGLSRESPFGFATYAMILCGIVGDTKGGYRFGRLALGLLSQLDAKEWTARVYGLVYYFVTHWQNPAKDSLDKFLHAHTVAMEVGDHEYAAWQFVNYAGTGLQTGQPLEPLHATIFHGNSICIDIKQILPQTLLIVWWQCIMNLMGQCDDPLELTGAAVPNEKKYLEDAASMNFALGIHTLYFLRMMLAYMLGEFALSADYGSKGREMIAQLAPGLQLVASHAYYDGLAACALLMCDTNNQIDRKKLTKVALKSKSKLRKWAALSPSNFQHMHLLLRAECAAFKGNKNKARVAYNEAIAVASKNGYMQDEAIANERASVFFAGLSDHDKALGYESRAYDLYTEWGAKIKVEHLEKNSITKQP